ncbi:hypothetical protein CRM22_005753 [Opisthorchis felineus]|uniref:C2H2-type domain-containing protein n=1 Tax=Opisthorchis felineus TaxID=147828 RepID=A0A4S2LPL5_OPIFE|nr:hypothetical protein CRM22_005753 [Opisthorchis felineus]TGZ65682.1 hypothetical protein CRM22_005753 [Opisthorchis felineus]
MPKPTLKRRNTFHSLRQSFPLSRATAKIKWSFNRGNCQQCPSCGQNFNSLAQMRVHQTRSHASDEITPRGHVCQVCDKKFAFISGLKTHIYLHHKAQSVVCDQCGKTFKHSLSLQSHVRRKHPSQGCLKPRLYCHVCKKSFEFQSLLRRHMLVHRKCDQRPPASDDLAPNNTGASNRRERLCPIEPTDNKIPKHECDVCRRKFHYKSKLQKHLFIHSPVKQFFCKVCGKRYSRPDSLLYHQRSKHTTSGSVS